MYPIWRFVLGLMLAVPVVSAAQDAPPLFSRCRDMVVLPVRVNGSGPYAFLLDINLPCPVISREVANALALKTRPAEKMTVQDSDATEMVVVDEMEYGALSESGISMAAINLALLQQRLGMEIAGILNGRELGGMVALNFSRNAFQVSTSQLAAVVKMDVNRSMPLRRNCDGQWEVRGLIEDKNACTFVVDTTFEGVVGFSEAALREMGCIKDTTRRLKTMSPVTPSEQVRLNRLRVGFAEMLDPVCTLLPTKTSPKIGMGFLKHFQVTFNFQQNMLCLVSTEPPPLRYPPITGCGLTPFRYLGGAWSVSVAAGSPAAREGLVSGCRIIALEKKDVTRYPYDDLLATLSGISGKSMTVTCLPPPEMADQNALPQTLTLVAEELL